MRVATMAIAATAAWLMIAPLSGKAGAAAMAPAPAAVVAEGERLAYAFGCVSCHNRDLTGHLVEEDRERLYAWSPNLTRLLPQRSDAEVATALRQGKRPDGSDIWVMPVHSFRLIDDREMAALIAFLRSVPAAGEVHPPAEFGPIAKAAIASGRAKSPAGFLPQFIARAPAEAAPAHREGRRLALLVCGDCHGPDLKGYDGEGAPANLDVAAAYDLPAFATLMRTGTRPDGSETAMTEVARDRTSHLTAAEVAAVWRYLRARAAPDS